MLYAMPNTETTPTTPPIEEVDTEFIEDLLLNIEEGRVVPIVGPELLVVEHEGQQVLLYRYLAERLAERLRIPFERLPPDFSLSDVAAAHARHNDIEEVYSKIRAIMEKCHFQPPDALLKLASITELKLFVTTTFDSLLQDALDQTRFGGVKRTAEVTYNPSDVNDLSADWDERSSPTVFHLFGKLSAAPTYVVTDADILEFLFAIQGNAPQLGHLFDALRGKHLLILGCAYPDWLARFFIRTTRPRSYQDRRSGREVIADTRAHQDASLTLFLNTFSKTTRIFGGNAITFIDRLHEQWKARHPDSTSTAAPVAPSAGSAEPMRADDVFISYSRADADAANRLFDGLRSRVDVWMDNRGGLGPAAEFAPRILAQIRSCSLFVPLISRTSAEREEGFYRKEWTEAERRLDSLKPGTPFVVPVVIDEVAMNHPGVPERFWAFNAQTLLGGNVTPEFLVWVVAKVRERKIAAPASR